MKDLKYLAAYSIPLTAVLALTAQGLWSYSTLIFAFVIIPILEPFLPKSRDNLTNEEKAERVKARIYDWMLYLNIPFLYGVVFTYLHLLNTADLTSSELTGLTLSCGIVVGTCGINVGHELGHRKSKVHRLMAKILLLPALYQHFFIEHNRGHHKHVATERDPASAPKGEILYIFWLRSLLGSYISAWNLEQERLQKEGKPFWSTANEMIWFHIVQLSYLVMVYYTFGSVGLMGAIGIGFIGILLLETINYVEHYGLRRQKLASGRYERVQPHHSWNANYELGRIILYELTRHSDHHFLANKEYQLLDHHDEAPELPLGYPASMLLAMVPPLWFKVMHRALPNT